MPRNFRDKSDHLLTYTLTVVELKPGGKTIPVTPDNRDEYIDLVLQTRMNEANVQLAAIKEGLKYDQSSREKLYLMKTDLHAPLKVSGGCCGTNWRRRSAVMLTLM